MDEPFINTDVFAQMIDENTAVWHSLASSIDKLPAELQDKLLALFEPVAKLDAPRIDRAQRMLYQALERASDDNIDEDVLQLLATYRKQVYGCEPGDIPSILLVEFLAPTAIALTFFLDSK